jgi:hypothetical protein
LSRVSKRSKKKDHTMHSEKICPFSRLGAGLKQISRNDV